MHEVKETAYCLDEVDQKILELLEKDARMSLKDIAECVFLSSTAVSTRIERLKEAGVIEGFQVQINPIALGYYTKAFINLEVEPNDKQDFYPFIKNCKNVVECNCVTGDYSMLWAEKNQHCAHRDAVGRRGRVHRRGICAGQVCHQQRNTLCGDDARTCADVHRRAAG